MASRTTFLALVLLCTSVLGIPHERVAAQDVNSIARRDNKWHLHCSNAPASEGGYMLDPGSVPQLPETLPGTGSNEQAMHFMWCTPGTKTYTFFDSFMLTPPPLDYMNFATAINETGKSFGNQADITVPDGGFTVDPAGTNVQVHMENANGRELTWGIVNSVLAGLYQYASVYEAGTDKQDPILFQVNEGEYGEVGIGYVAFLRPWDGKCILQIDKGKETPCEDLKKHIH